MTSKSVKLDMLKLTSQVLEEIKEEQKKILELVERLALTNQGGVDFIVDENGIMRFRDIVCVPNLPELQ